MTGTLTRRRLIQTVGSLAGGSAAYATMQAMGLLATPAAAYGGPPDLPSDLGSGRRVAILGAGIAGMTAAYELSRAGFDVTVLEATDRAGGRNRTYRGGDEIVEIDGIQRIEWDRDPGLYFNAGPARLPYHHQGILSYARQFGVPLEPIVNDNRGAYFQNDAAFGGTPIRNRRMVNDTQGFVAQLLHKAVSQNALDQELDGVDKETFLEFLSSFGSLSTDGTYAGSDRSGYETPPGSGLSPPGDNLAPLDMSEVLSSQFWGYQLFFGEGFNQAATMMQPVGGMDRIAAAFAERVGGMIGYGNVVTRLRRTETGAQVTYTDADGAEQMMEADHVIVTIPFSVLATIDTDFSDDVNRAISEVGYVKAGKAGFQSPRFWEREDWIYGGISWSADDITQIWYPTGGFGTDQGILVGAYIWNDEIGERFGAMSYPERLDMVIRQGAKIHPSYADHVTGGASIAWDKIPYAIGGWANWSSEARETSYPAVTRPDGPYYFAGEHISHITGWQEGSVLSAHDSVSAIAERVASANP